MKSLLPALLLLFFSYPVQAFDTGPWLGLYTYHISRDRPVNERNQLLGWQYNRWLVARFTNSFDETSYSLGYRWKEWPVPLSERSRLNFGLSPGVAYGYGDRLTAGFAGFTPGLIPSASLEWRYSPQWSVSKDFLYIWTKNGGVVLGGLSIKWHSHP
ncbi:MAG: hypothetical protein LAT65_08160 [Saccharospirillum sp.]|nr:hypothetical protein [Saccharospirillum sp.]